MTPVAASVAGSGYLRPDAKTQYDALNAAFRNRFGKSLSITEGYRDYDRQVRYYNAWKAGTGNYAADPGTSNHGWGTACDFGSGVDSYGTAEKNWMNANAPSYGWQPTGDGFPYREAWHFDFTRAWDGSGTTPTTPTTPTVPEEDELKLISIICDAGATNHGEYGSTGIITEATGFKRTSTGLGERGQFQAYLLGAGALGIPVVEKHVDSAGWTFAQLFSK